MTDKKKRILDIRGWFPQEPLTISTRLKVNNENRQPPLIIPPEYKISATKVAGATAIFWIILYSSTFFTFLNIERYPIPGFQAAAWITAGLAVGTISCAAFTKNQLSRLSRNYRFSTDTKDVVLLIVPAVLFFMFGFFISWSISDVARHLPSLQGLLFSFYAWGVSFEITRVVLFASFEKRENMRIVQSWFGGEFLLIPKAPSSNVNRSETTANRELPSLSEVTVRA
jgi:hypothetical protein